MPSEKFLILIFLIVPAIGIPQSVIDNSQQQLGEMCTLGSNKLGMCKDIMDCEFAKQLFDQKKFAEIVRCKFVGAKPLVCCPTKIVGTEIAVPIRAQQSPKFLTALCTMKQPAPLNLNLDFHIINGERAGVGEFPYQVALGYKNQDGNIEFKCGGSLIADDYVLTAAHCHGREIPFMVRLGRTSLDLTDEDDQSIAQDIEIDTMTIHKEYKRYPRQNDIALIKLKRPVTLTDTVDKVCLSSDGDTSNKNLTITGFGEDDTNTKHRSDWLLKGTVYEVPLAQCKERIESIEKRLKIDNTQLCAINLNGTDGCQGDSGGPMVYFKNGQPNLVGVISYGNGCGGTVPGVYTRVDRYHDWINEKMLLLG